MTRSKSWLALSGSLFAHLLRTFAENAWRSVVFLQLILPDQPRESGDFNALLSALFMLALVTLLPPIVLAPFMRYLVGGPQTLAVGTLASLLGVLGYHFMPTLPMAYLSLGVFAASSSIMAVHRLSSVSTWSVRLHKPPIEIDYLFMLTAAIGVLVGLLFFSSQSLSMTSLIVTGALALAFVGYQFATAKIAPLASMMTDVKTLFGWFPYRLAFLANIALVPIGLMVLTLVIFPASGEWPTWEQLRPLEGIVLGIGIGSIQQNAHRTRGMVFYWSPIFLGFLLYAFFTGAWNNLGLWLTLGGLFTAVRLTYSIEGDHLIGTASALLHALSAALGLGMIGIIYAIGSAATLHAVLPWGILISSCTYSLIFSYFYSRQAFESFVEIVLFPMYRIESIGPGTISVPMKGPYIVLSNHACWLDPFWIAKVINGPTQPMMTASFYDIPVLQFFMARVIKAIRVIETPVRRETPELQEAIATLKRGESVMIFPEGYLRRKEEIPLRRFGRGIWEILKAVPDVPIIVCWIEGGWQSFTSFYNGPPTRNKKLDIRRSIRIAISDPEPIDPKLLESHNATRLHLMHRVAQVRAELGLPAIELNAARDEEPTE